MKCYFSKVVILYYPIEFLLAKRDHDSLFPNIPVLDQYTN